MRKYKQLTEAQRCQIDALKRSGSSQQKISNLLGVNQSTLSRELARNGEADRYDYERACQRALQRRNQAPKAVKMTSELIDLIEDKIKEKWSPEQVCGWFLTEKNLRISHERIYQHIRADKKSGGTLFRHLRRKGKKYQCRVNGKTGRGQIKNRVSIDARPAVVDEKLEVGHWEIDTVIGKGHSGALVTIVERVTRFTVSQQLQGKSAEEVTAATITLLTPLKKLVHTITADNGREFSHHEKITAALECSFYFAHPYHSWERGLNENTNGLLRQYFPKSTDFKKVLNTEVVAAIEQLNNRPRKVLAFKTPADLMRLYMSAKAA